MIFKMSEEKEMKEYAISILEQLDVEQEHLNECIEEIIEYCSSYERKVYIVYRPMTDADLEKLSMTSPRIANAIRELIRTKEKDIKIDGDTYVVRGVRQAWEMTNWSTLLSWEQRKIRPYMQPIESFALIMGQGGDGDGFHNIQYRARIDPDTLEFVEY